MDYPGAYGGTSHCSITSDDGYILFGTTSTYASGGPTDSDLYLVKTDSVGTMKWNKVYGLSNGMEGVGYGFGRCVQQTADKGYIMTGSTDGWGAGNRDILVLKTDSAGNLQWAKTYGGSYQDRATSIREVGGAIGYILTAVSYGAETPQNSFRTMMVRLDGSGNVMWCKMYGSVTSNPSNASDEGYYVDVVPGTNGGFVFSGHTNSMGLGNADIWLVKTDANGVSGCNEIAQTLIPSIPQLIISSAGNDTSMAFTQPEDSVIYMSSWIYQDSVLCPTPINPVVEEEELQYLILIYPNPSSGIFTIRTEQLQLKNIEVINVLGEKILAGDRPRAVSSNGQSIDLSKQPDGIYFVRVQTEKGMVSKKIVIRK